MKTPRDMRELGSDRRGLTPEDLWTVMAEVCERLDRIAAALEARNEESTNES